MGTAVVVVAGLEAGSYLLGTHPGPAQPLRRGAISIFGRHDHLLFWRLEPGRHDLPEPINAPITINSHGLRGPEIGPKGDDETRILCLGESTTFAVRMPYRQGYVAVLERLLSDDDVGGPVQVINGGTPGYTSFQGLRLLEQVGLDLDLDVVVVAFGVNDFLPVASLAERTGEEPEDVAGLNDRQLYERRTRLAQRVGAWLTAHSNLYRTLVYPRRDPDAEESDLPPVTTEGADPRVPESDREYVLEQLLALCRAHGIELVLVVPWYREFTGHAPLLRRFARQNDVTLVDLPKLIPPRLQASSREYFFDPVHPVPAGHALIGEALYEVLVAKGL